MFGKATRGVSIEEMNAAKLMKSGAPSTLKSKSQVNLQSFAALLAITQRGVHENGSMTAKDFNVTKWLTGWLNRPNPALGGKPPASFLGTDE